MWLERIGEYRLSGETGREGKIYTHLPKGKTQDLGKCRADLGSYTEVIFTQSPWLLPFLEDRRRAGTLLHRNLAKPVKWFWCWPLGPLPSTDQPLIRFGGFSLSSQQPEASVTTRQPSALLCSDLCCVSISPRKSKSPFCGLQGSPVPALVTSPTSPPATGPCTHSAPTTLVSSLFL